MLPRGQGRDARPLGLWDPGGHRRARGSQEVDVTRDTEGRVRGPGLAGDLQERRLGTLEAPNSCTSGLAPPASCQDRGLRAAGESGRFAGSPPVCGACSQYPGPCRRQRPSTGPAPRATGWPAGVPSLQALAWAGCTCRKSVPTPVPPHTQVGTPRKQTPGSRWPPAGPHAPPCRAPSSPQLCSPRDTPLQWAPC